MSDLPLFKIPRRERQRGLVCFPDLSETRAATATFSPHLSGCVKSTRLEFRDSGLSAEGL